MRPPQPHNAHPTSITTTANYLDEVERRAKEAKREKRVSKDEKLAAKNVELTQQDVFKKKEHASAPKASHPKKNIDDPSSASKPRRKLYLRETRKLHQMKPNTLLALKKMLLKEILKTFSMTSWQYLTSLPRVHPLEGFAFSKKIS